LPSQPAQPGGADGRSPHHRRFRRDGHHDGTAETADGRARVPDFAILTIAVVAAAEAGIREAWIVDVEAEIVVQYTQAIGRQYLTRREYRRGDSTTSVAAPGITLQVTHIFG